MAHLILKDVSLSYEGKIVVKGLSFELPRGAYLCIIGENGSGKSTLVKGILGLKEPAGGSIQYGEGLERRQIGYLPQQSGIHRDFPATVQEVIWSGFLNRHGFFPFYRKEEKERSWEAMELLGIQNLGKRCFQELSGGQQQRVLLARALCAAGSMLLLDEPTAGLDPEAREELYEVLEELHQKKHLTILMVSHDLEGVRRYATHILRLHEDRYFFGSLPEYEQEEHKNGRIF